MYYYRGDESLLLMPCVAVIGSRNASKLACMKAYSISSWLARKGVVIVSGLAKGIDTAAHKGALSVKGKTIAVLATSLEKTYPYENKELSRIIGERGLLVTEYCQDKFEPKRFFERDLVIAQISKVVIPVQAKISSGTLHTVNAAIRYGKTICIPNSDKNDLSKYPELYSGINKLIESGIHEVFNEEEYPKILDLLT